MTTLVRRARREWALAVALLVALAAWLAWAHLARVSQVETAEGRRLQAQVRLLDLNLSRQLEGAHRALSALGSDLSAGVLPPGYADAQLRTLQQAWPGVREIEWLAPSGRVRASSRPGRTGLDAAGKPVVQRVLARPQPGLLHVDLAARAAAGDAEDVWSLDLALPLPAPTGEAEGPGPALSGLLVATLDRTYFLTLMHSANYADDMGSAMARGDGLQLLTDPPSAGALGANLARPGSMFTRHQESGLASTLLVGRTLGDPGTRLIAQRTLLSAGLPLELPLVLAASRDRDAVLAPPRREAALYAALLAVVALAGGSLLAMIQRQRAAAQRQRQVEDDRATADAEFLALALSGGDLALWDANLDTGQGQVNDRWFAMLGLQRNEVSPDASAWETLLHPDERERVLAEQQAHIDGLTPAFESRYRLRHKGGGWVWVLDRGRVVLRDADGRARRMAGTHLDITDRVLAEDALRASEAQMRTASRMARVGAWSLDRASDTWHLSPELAEWMELDPAQPADAARALTFVAPADTLRWQQRVAACLDQGLPFDEEIAATSRGGRPLLLRVMGEAVRDASGRITGLRGAAQDISESRRAQQQLRLLEASVARLNDVVLITEADPLHEPGPRIVFVNPAFERLSGWRPDEVIGRSPRLLQGPDTDRAELARIGQALARGEGVRAELVNYDRQGRPYWIELTIVPLLDAAGRATHMVAVQRDISERRQAEDARRALERRLREAQKMESIGTLAGGIAHDFNNILAAILGNAALAAEDLAALPAAAPAAGARASLEQIQKAGQRARSLVQQILTFSRRQPQPLGVQALRPVVEETLALLRSTLPAGVQLVCELGEDPLPVQADATQLQQVVMNLCTNAWQALPAGQGQVHIVLEAVADAAHVLGADVTHRLGEMPTGPCAHLRVGDTGAGIDEGTLSRIFDPFFTTKPVGQGTGLGLSVVHGIVQAHHGLIGVASRRGQGSRFHVLLPLAGVGQLTVPVAPPAQAEARPAGGGGRQVLYVDDDEVMVLMVQRLLQRAGWDVTACSDAREALSLVTARPARFDVVVTDYNMPDLSGLDLARELLVLRPDLPVLISSGYVSDELQAQALRLGVRALLKKENTLEELAVMLQALVAPASFPGRLLESD